MEPEIQGRVTWLRRIHLEYSTSKQAEQILKEGRKQLYWNIETERNPRAFREKQKYLANN